MTARVYDKTLADQGPISLTTELGKMSLGFLRGFSLEIPFTATSSFTGQITLQASNTGSNWIDIVSDEASGTSGVCMFNISDSMYKYVRIKATIATGSILTLIPTIYGKGW